MPPQKISLEELLESWFTAYQKHVDAQQAVNAANVTLSNASKNLTDVGTAISQLAEPVQTAYAVNGHAILVQKGSFPRFIPLRQIS